MCQQTTEQLKKRLGVGQFPTGLRQRLQGIAGNHVAAGGNNLCAAQMLPAVLGDGVEPDETTAEPFGFQKRR